MNIALPYNIILKSISFQKKSEYSWFMLFGTQSYFNKRKK